jgi:hypothetical protein
MGTFPSIASSSGKGLVLGSIGSPFRAQACQTQFWPRDRRGSLPQNTCTRHQTQRIQRFATPNDAEKNESTVHAEKQQSISKRAKQTGQLSIHPPLSLSS